MDEWRKIMWSIYITEFYSAIKKNKIMSIVGKWMELKILMFRKTNIIFSLICRIKILKKPGFTGSSLQSKYLRGRDEANPGKSLWEPISKNGWARWLVPVISSYAGKHK
jgi:hypothetical protein